MTTSLDYVEQHFIYTGASYLDQREDSSKEPSLYQSDKTTDTEDEEEEPYGLECVNRQSRLKTVFQKLRGITMNSTYPTDCDSKPPSFTDKLKAKFRSSECQLPRSVSHSSMNKKKYSFSRMTRSFSSYYLSPLRQTSHEPDISQPKLVRFAKSIVVNETYSKSDYDRQSDPDAVCSRLTPLLAQQIKEELNSFKLYEMQVHEYSRIHTHFFL